MDCAIAWEGPNDDQDVRQWMKGLAERVLAGLSASGLQSDEHGAVASNPLFARSVDAWEAAARAWVEEPERARGLMLLSVAVESDPVWGATTVADRLTSAFARTPDREEMLLRLASASAGRAAPDRLSAPLRIALDRRAERRARHQARRAAPDRDARSLERARGPA